MSQYEKRKREMLRRCRLESGDEVVPDHVYLEICGAARVGRRTWKWP